MRFCVKQYKNQFLSGIESNKMLLKIILVLTVLSLSLCDDIENNLSDETENNSEIEFTTTPFPFKNFGGEVPNFNEPVRVIFFQSFTSYMFNLKYLDSCIQCSDKLSCRSKTR